MRNLNRRSLLLGGCTTAALLAIPKFTAGDTAAPHRSGEVGLIAKMSWLNEPARFQRSGGQLMVRPRPKTDFWRKTFTDTVADNGHFLHLSVTGNFVFEARVNGKYSSQYDQAGIMVRIDPENWMKCGTEFFQGQRHASVVFTRDFSDWSLMKDLSNSEPVIWRVSRHRNSVEVSCSLDGASFTMVRSGYFPPSPNAQVGIMCAAPEGEGFEAVFDSLRLSAH
jgi:regulation of enolase protein 1 (concanavalin A-like superfamily)